ncbi:unnamed protein product [Pedinophyceae sp. YPF-701]|nr:unnamed protein product [Pedinophyceae sp. YPF-701]
MFAARALARPSARLAAVRAPLRSVAHPQRASIRARATSTEVKDAPAAKVDPTSLTSDGSAPSWQIRMLYDGDCPLCMREVDMLRNRDAGVGKIDFVDIASPDYSAEKNGGISFEEAMGEIHAITADGRIVTNIEVFRLLYEAVGLGWVYAVTRVPWVEAAANKVYGVWAKYRLPVTGRPDLATVLAEKRSCKTDEACELPGAGERKSS